jgi:hypothetical protein
MEKEAKRAAKLEQKVGVVTGGLQARQQKLRGEAEEAWAALRTAATELECFRCGVQAGQARCWLAGRLWRPGCRLLGCLLWGLVHHCLALPAQLLSLACGEHHSRRRLPPAPVRALHEVEQRSAPDRIEALQGLVAAQTARERDLQERFKRLCEEREDLRAALSVQAAPAPAP